MAKNEITTLVCKSCKEEVSGPDEADVQATMKRHEEKHAKKVKK